MRERILITGALGEVGHGLLKYFKEHDCEIVAVDLRDASNEVLEELKSSKSQILFRKGSIIEESLINELKEGKKFDKIFHLAVLLSSAGERDPLRAHDVNVNGSLALLHLAHFQSTRDNSPVRFILPSTIAVYGPEVENADMSCCKEGEHLNPITMYGINKLYVENLGRYFANNYGMLSGDKDSTRIDFRALRFPGLISADTVPSGGTSDYAAEMVHAAAKGESYECFVKAESKLPFMTMPDAVRALVELSEAKRENLKKSVYNVGAFACSASEIEAAVKKAFPDAKISYKPNQARLKIVESWSRDVDSSAARKDWCWRAQFDFEKAFREYLIPKVVERYK